MFDAQVMFAQGTNTTTLYGPWFSRGGDLGRFTVEVVGFSEIDVLCYLDVQLVHKNVSDVGNGVDVGLQIRADSDNWPATRRWSVEVGSGFKEMVRYRFAFQNGVGEDTSWVMFRMLPPIWFNKL